MLEFNKTLHGFTTMFPKPIFWTDDKYYNSQMKRGFSSILIEKNEDFICRCTSDEENIYLLGDVSNEKIFEDCIINGLVCVLQCAFMDYIDNELEKLNISQEEENEIFCEMFDNWVGIDCLFRDENEIKKLIKNDINNIYKKGL